MRAEMETRVDHEQGCVPELSASQAVPVAARCVQLSDLLPGRAPAGAEAGGHEAALTWSVDRDQCGPRLACGEWLC